LVSNNRFYLNQNTKNAISTLDGVKPYTNVSYINASRKEQLISISHYQKLGKAVNFGFNYTRLSSPGSYINQEMNNTLFDVSLGYVSKRNIYSFEFSTFIKRIFLQENGGLLNPLDLENNVFSNRRSYNVNLETSKSLNKNYDYRLNQRFKLFAFNNDTLIGNGIFTKLESRFFANTHVFNDNDPTSLIYNDIFIDSLSTIDSIFNRILTNQFAISLTKKNTEVDLFTQFDINEYHQVVGLDTSYNDFYTGIALDKRVEQFNIFFKGKYAISGYRTGDVDVDLASSYFFKDKIQFNFNSSYHLNEPDLRYVNYTSNHFDWKNNNLEKQAVFSNQLHIAFKSIKTDLTVENKVFNQFIYLDSNAIASQSKSTNSISTFKLSKDYKVLNFHFRTAVFYQLTSDENLFPLPEFIGRQLIYYENYLFKKALKIQIGGNLSFKTDYYGYGYMPALNEFYAQSATMIGSYPYFDIFINTKLKRAQIFFKYEHFNAGWNGYTYYASPAYPRLDKSFKFGVSWNMFD
jgi:hypothetical protein